MTSFQLTTGTEPCRNGEVKCESGARRFTADARGRFQARRNKRRKRSNAGNCPILFHGFFPLETFPAALDRGGRTGQPCLVHTGKTAKMTRDEEHLRLLSIFHYVVGGFAALFALFPIIHLIMGLVIIFAPNMFAGNGQPPPAFFGWFFVVFAVLFIILGWTFAICILTTGRFLARRKHYMFCLVMAGVECLFMPFGTVLGVFTIVTLTREPVKQLFGANPPETAARGQQ